MYKTLVPIMTSNDCLEPDIVLKGANTLSGCQPYYAFNGTNEHDKDCWTTGSTSGYLMITFLNPVKVSGMTMTSRNTTGTVNTKTIRFQISTDNKSYTTVENIEPPSTADTTQDYFFDTEYECTSIKLSTGASGVAFGKLNFYTYVDAILLKSEGEYYDIDSSFYDEVNKCYTPIEVSKDELEDRIRNANGSLETLTQEITIGDETFKPIDKFKSFKILSTKEQVDKSGEILNVNGIKSRAELIVANDDIPFYIAKETLSFTLENTLTDEGSCYMAFSTDNGNSWRISKDGAFQDLEGVTIPAKPYHSLNAEEKEQIEEAKKRIIEGAMTPSVLASSDFNLLQGAKSMRFAYVLVKPTWKARADVHELMWNFNSVGFMRKLKSTDYELDLFENHVGIIPSEEHEMLKVNILANSHEEQLMTTYDKTFYF